MLFYKVDIAFSFTVVLLKGISFSFCLDLFISDLFNFGIVAIFMNSWLIINQLFIRYLNGQLKSWNGIRYQIHFTYLPFLV